MLRGRLLVTTNLYDDPDHPERITGTVQSPAWTEDDRALMLALQTYESSLCGGPCGQPREVAWHSELEGWFESHKYVCHGCSALRGEQVVYAVAVNEYPFEAKPPLPPFRLGETTTPPD